MYQPPESGPRDKATETEGGVASYWIGPKLAGALTFPALSVHVPENAEELKAAAPDPLRLTAYQYNAECPGSDLAEVLRKGKDSRRRY